jgi:hypothetical protein
MVEPEAEQPAFTPEDESFAKNLAKKTDFYDILGVEKSATED